MEGPNGKILFFLLKLRKNPQVFIFANIAKPSSALH
jgi:hypothetical protein